MRGPVYSHRGNVQTRVARPTDSTGHRSALASNPSCDEANLVASPLPSGAASLECVADECPVPTELPAPSLVDDSSSSEDATPSSADAAVLGGVDPHDPADGVDAPRVAGLGPAQVERVRALLDGAVSPYNTRRRVDRAMERLDAAQEAFFALDQAATDRVFRAVAMEASRHRVLLASLAAVETRMGQLEDKIAKNHFAASGGGDEAEYVYSRHRDTKTVGVVSRDEAKGLVELADPAGPIAALVPCTNPTSTVIFKALAGLKGRNAVCFLPHPRAAGSVWYASELLRKAAVAAGAPEDCLMCLHPASVELTNYAMRHDKVRLVLATGGNKMVQAAYKSGHPAIGVGAGNAPVLIDETADLETAASFVVTGKVFDQGLICAAEQAVVVVRAVAKALELRFRSRGVYFCSDNERDALEAVFWRGGRLNSAVVGQPAEAIAAMAGFQVPPGTLVLAVRESRVGPDVPFSHEKLSPIIAWYEVEDFAAGCDLARRLIDGGGSGHAAALHTREGHQRRIDAFARSVSSCHIQVNMPSAIGVLGSAFNPHLEPSLTLGVGTRGGSSVSRNVGPLDLLNFRRVALRREHVEWFKVPSSVYFNAGCLSEALRDATSPQGAGVKHKRAFIVAGHTINRLGQLDEVRRQLDEAGIAHESFLDVEPDPSMDTVRRGVEAMRALKPDLLIAVGGGSPMDAAKVMRLHYEHPELTLEDMAVRFVEIRHRVVTFPEKTGDDKIRRFICVPTTSGTGSEMTPFAVVTDDGGKKRPIVSYRWMTPDIAIVDPSLAASMPRKLAAATGLDALSHAIESLVSCYASSYTQPLSLRAAQSLFNNLEAAVGPTSEGKDDGAALDDDARDAQDAARLHARAEVHHASAVAGMAFANAFLGVCHSCAHQLGARFHVPHGVANAILLPYVVAYNASLAPTRQTPFPQYGHPSAARDYADLARSLRLPGCTGGQCNDAPLAPLGEAASAGAETGNFAVALADADQAAADSRAVEALIDELRALTRRCGVPTSLREWGVDEAAFLDAVDDLALDAFDDQCTGTNPRFPLVSELRQIMLDAFEGDTPLLS